MQQFRCKICKEPTSIAVKHDHHVIPRAAGGENGEQIRICAYCHTNVHNLAWMLASNKKSHLVGDEARLLYPLDRYPDQATIIKAILNYADIIRKAFMAKKDGQVSAEAEIVTIYLRPQVKAYLKIIAKDAHMPLNKFIENLLLTTVKKRFLLDD